MCFSAEASFSTGFLLSVIGVASLSIAKPKQILLALMPLLFALQQISEGVLWLKMEGVISTDLGIISQTIYMFFAYLFWPIWIPLAFWTAEDVSWKRGFIALCLVGGIILMGFNLWGALGMESEVRILGKHLQYLVTAPTIKFPYFIIILVPILLSSLRGMWIFGLLAAGSYALASIYQPEVFASIWCFFAAIISSSLLILLWINRDVQIKQKN